MVVGAWLVEVTVVSGAEVAVVDVPGVDEELVDDDVVPVRPEVDEVIEPPGAVPEGSDVEVVEPTAEPGVDDEEPPPLTVTDGFDEEPGTDKVGGSGPMATLSTSVEGELSETALRAAPTPRVEAPTTVITAKAFRAPRTALIRVPRAATRASISSLGVATGQSRSAMGGSSLQVHHRPEPGPQRRQPPVKVGFHRSG